MQETRDTGWFHGRAGFARARATMLARSVEGCQLVELVLSQLS
jgi:hypothetical protein